MFYEEPDWIVAMLEAKMAHEMWCKQRLYTFLSSFTLYYVSCDLQKWDVDGSTTFVVLRQHQPIFGWFQGVHVISPGRTCSWININNIPVRAVNVKIRLKTMGFLHHS